MGLGLRTDSAMRKAFESSAENKVNRCFVVHQKRASYRAKWLPIRYCQNALFQGFAGAADGADSGLFDGRSGGPERRRRRRPVAAANWQLERSSRAPFRADFSLFALSVPGGRH